MEWNAKSLGQWDLEHLFFFNTKATENPKLQPFDWSGEADQEISISSGCSESELIHLYSSRSPKSASNNSSSSNGDSKTSMSLTLGSQEDASTGKKELSKEDEISPAAAELPFGEPLLTLGKRLYFENPGTGSLSKKPSSSEVISHGKKCKTRTHNMQNPTPTCQVEGCGLDLSSAKDYHRKHRVCESHSKSPKVVIAGLERRFCQQCSRFHALSEFDDKKRSCKRRLLDHNARRRKPQPEVVQLNPSALSSPLHDQRQTMSSDLFSRTATSLAWQDAHSSKFAQTKDFLWKPAKAFNKMPNTVTMVSDDSNGLLTSKGIATKSFVPGIEDPITLCGPNATQEVNRALSLLSANFSWSEYETNSLSHSSSEYWFADSDNSNRFQEFQQLNAPYESNFPCNHQD